MTKKNQTPASETITVNQLASLANLTPRRIRQLGEEGKLTKPENGRLPLVESIRALFKHYQKDGVTLEREKTLKVCAERKLREHELARTEGQYLLRSDVGRMAANVGAFLRGTLIRRLTHDFPIKAETDAPPEIKAVCRTAATAVGEQTCDELLAYLRRELLKYDEKPVDPAQGVNETSH